VRDNGDSGLVNWTINLAGDSTGSTVTDAGGNYSFANLKPGSYTVSEQAQAGWSQTFPLNNASYNIIVPSGLDTSGLDFGNHYAPSIDYPVIPGWNLLSLPLTILNSQYDSLYPFANSKPYIYDNVYKNIDTIPNGVGYWIKFPSLQNITLQGNVRITDTLNLGAGWHMIGTLTYPVSLTNIIQEPDSLISSSFYSYDGGYHSATDSLYPHQGYWAKTKSSGKLILNTTGQNISLSRFRTANEFLSGLNNITIKDQQGSSQTLYFGNDHKLLEKTELFELPPPAPSGLLDARFSTGTFAASSRANENLLINLRGGSYPLLISWDIKDANVPYVLSSEKNRGIGWSQGLSNKGRMSLDNPAITILHLQQKTEAALQPLPSVFALEANYPNPFNPSTTISYALPADAVVKIQIFNLIGQHIADLVNKAQPAGRYSITWDATSSVRLELPGGIYLYRLDAYPTDGSKPFSQMRKMVLLK
jgi:hypothetical protein